MSKVAKKNQTTDGAVLGCSRKLGSMVIGSMGFFTDPYKWGIPWGEITHLPSLKLTVRP